MVFTDAKHVNTYIGLSAIFLTQNGVCVAAFLFINLNTSKASLRHFLNKYLDKSDSVPDPNRNCDLLDEVK